MKNIIFLSYLNIWSMDDNKGAQSFFKTIEAYINDGWNVVLINPKYNEGVTPPIEGLSIKSFNPIFYPLLKIKKVSFFARILHSLHGDYMFKKFGKEQLGLFDNNAVIYSYEVHGVKAGKKLKDKYEIPFITRFQGTTLAPIQNNIINRLKKYPHFHAIETTADITIMTDDGTQGDKVLKNLNNKSKQIMFWRNGVDIDLESVNNELDTTILKANLGLKPENRVLLTVSRLASWKRVNRAIEAMPRVLEEDPSVKLVIVGDGDEKENLINLVQKLSLEEQVIFVGSVSQKNIKYYLELADLFLSLYDLSNVGNPLLEAMSVGKTIITLDVGDTSTLIENNENGVLLKLSELDKLPHKIIELLNNDIYAKELGVNAKSYADNNFWDWRNRMSAETEIVNKLIKDKL